MVGHRCFPFVADVTEQEVLPSYFLLIAVCFKGLDLHITLSAEDNRVTLLKIIRKTGLFNQECDEWELSDELNSVKAILENERAVKQVNALTEADIKDMICKEIAAAGTPPTSTTPTKDTFKKVKRAEGYSNRGQPLWYCYTHRITQQ